MKSYRNGPLYCAYIAEPSLEMLCGLMAQTFAPHTLDVYLQRKHPFPNALLCIFMSYSSKEEFVIALLIFHVWAHQPTTLTFLQMYHIKMFLQKCQVGPLVVSTAQPPLALLN